MNEKEKEKGELGWKMQENKQNRGGNKTKK